MPVSVGKIADQVNAKILEGGQNFIDAARLVGSVEALESRFSVANIAALPPAADNTGRFIYVEDIEAYRYSDGTQWTNDYDTTRSTISTQLWAWGYNVCGTIGDGTTTSHCSPVREFCSATDWCQVSSAQTHTAAIKTSGELWSWGRGQFRELGDGTVTTRFSPVREFCSATNWCQVSAGNSSTSAIKTSGELWSWGDATCGRLGDGFVLSRCSPVREFCSATDWCQVGRGRYHTAAVKTSGQLWSWGSSGCGQLGDGTVTDKCSAIREICSATDWCQVSGGNNFTSAVKTSGQLWAWGNNGVGRLGDGTTTTRCSPVREFCSATDWCQVSAGNAHTGAIKTSGELWAWGCNGNGRLGNGTQNTHCSPVREFCSATNWCQVNGGDFQSAAIKTSGELWAWGLNFCGGLGDGTVTSKCSPIREICSATDWCQVSVYRTATAIKATCVKGFNEP